MLLSACLLLCLWAIPSVLACERIHTVKTKTASHEDAGTDGSVEMKFLMNDGESSWHQLDTWPKDDLLPGAKDTFKIGVCPQGDLNGFILRHTGTRDWWYPISVTIEYPIHPVVRCQLNQWLTGDRYIACLENNFPTWNKKLHDQGYFNTANERYLVAIRAGGYRYMTTQYKDDCYFWNENTGGISGYLGGNDAICKQSS